MSKPVIIVGATNLGKAVMEVFKSNEVVVYGFLDDNQKLHGTEIDDVSVLGSADSPEYRKIIGKTCDVFVASDDNAWRARMIKDLRETRETMPVNAIHKSVQIATSAILHHGTLMNQGVKIGSEASIGNHCIINAGAVVDYNARIGDFVQIGAGAVISADVSIGDGAFIGAGSTIIPGIKIGEGGRVGAGSVVIANVGKNETVFGNPAKTIK
jgi:sugar O-acyltransferase (sialic acid O-acetyltransferase NeuD family)